MAIVKGVRTAKVANGSYVLRYVSLIFHALSRHTHQENYVNTVVGQARKERTSYSFSGWILVDLPSY